MPTHWTGTLNDRYERLEEADRRCDGNNRRCTRGAVKRFVLAPAREFILIPGQQHVTKLSCSRHVQQFVSNPNYVLIDTKRLAPRPPGAAHPHTIY